MGRFLFSVAITAALSLPAVSFAANPQDQQIADKIKQKLGEAKQQGKLKGFSLDMAVESGAVTLKGHVSSAEQRFLVLDIARRIKGVTQVGNGITIRQAKPNLIVAKSATPIEAKPQSGKSMRRQPEIMKSVVKTPAETKTPAENETKPLTKRETAEPKTLSVLKQKPPAAPKSTPAPTNPMVQAVDSRAADQQIARTITGYLREQKNSGSLRGFGINMRVDGGVVALNGHVATQQQKTLVLEITRRVAGVQKVVDGLSIKSKSAQFAARSGKPKALTSIGTLKEALQPNRKQAFAPVDSQQPSLIPHNLQQAALAQQQQAFGSGVRQAAQLQPGIQQPIQAEQPMQALPMQAQQQLSQGIPLSPEAVMAALAQQGRQIPAQYVPTNQPQMRRVPMNHGGANYFLANQTPIPYAPARGASYGMQQGGFQQGGFQQGGFQQGGAGGGMVMPMGGNSMMRSHHDQPQMPNYSWPSYAPHPNYGAVTYPKQYSPSAWPYIGPFYPYPQVPLGWRSVTLKWKDGWWFLDFKDRPN